MCAWFLLHDASCYLEISVLFHIKIDQKLMENENRFSVEYAYFFLRRSDLKSNC